MEKHSLIIDIFGRKFPARVSSEEAKVIEAAARSINAKIKAFRAEYTTQEDLDIVIMCCLDIMTEYLTEKAKTEQQTHTLLSELQALEDRLDHHLAATEEL